jgi:hypothetical protein
VLREVNDDFSNVLDPAFSSRGTRHVDPTSEHVIDTGRDSESGGAKIGRKRKASTEQSGEFSLKYKWHF